MLVTLALLVSFAAPEDCLTQPLELRASDYLTMGRVAETWTAQSCQRFIGNAERAPYFGNQVIGRTRFGRFSLFGQQLGWGVNVVTRPGTRIGEPDQMFAAPALDLPPSWQQAIDKATVPVLAVGGAVVLTSVLLGVLGK